MKTKFLITLLGGALLLFAFFWGGYRYGVKSERKEISQTHDFYKSLILNRDVDFLKFQQECFFFPQSYGESLIADTIDMFLLSIAMASLCDSCSYYNAYEAATLLCYSDDSLSIPIRCLQLGVKKKEISCIEKMSSWYYENGDTLSSLIMGAKSQVEKDENKMDYIKKRAKYIPSEIYSIDKHNAGITFFYRFNYKGGQYRNLFWSHDTIRFHVGDSVAVCFDSLHPSENICVSNYELLRDEMK